MIRLIKLTLGTLIIGYSAMSAFLYFDQDRLLYHPTPKVETDYPVIVLEQDDANVTVYIVNHGKENALLYFGGNAESVAVSAENVARQFPETTCYLMDYRGYGRSTGKPSEIAIYADALTLYDKIKEQHHRISLMGRSLGTGVATYVASHRRIDKMVLITPYDSIKSVAQSHYPVFPVGLLLKDTYDSLSRVPNIDAQTLIVLAEKDKVIPKVHTLRLIEAFPRSQIKVGIIQNRGHDDIVNDPDYDRLIRYFMNMRME